MSPSSLFFSSGHNDCVHIWNSAVCVDTVELNKATVFDKEALKVVQLGGWGVLCGQTAVAASPLCGDSLCQGIPELGYCDTLLLVYWPPTGG